MFIVCKFVYDTIFVGYFRIFDYFKINSKSVQSSCLCLPFCSRFHIVTY